VVLRAHMDLVMNLLVVIVFVVLTGIAPRPSWLELPILALGLAALGLGLSLLLSALYVRLRDIDQLWSVLAQILFFGSAILYVVAAMPAGLRRPLILFNPLATIFTQIRHALIDPHAPTAAAVAGGPLYLLVPIAVTVAIIALGAAVFARMAPTAAEYL
jgi:ABC-2 type transport system permease protein